MIICLCHSLSDNTLKSLIFSGANTMKKLTQACKVGSSCGSCKPLVEELLNSNKGVLKAHHCDSEAVFKTLPREPHEKNRLKPKRNHLSAQ